MQIKAEEISKIIQDQIENYESRVRNERNRHRYLPR